MEKRLVATILLCLGVMFLYTGVILPLISPPVEKPPEEKKDPAKITKKDPDKKDPDQKDPDKKDPDKKDPDKKDPDKKPTKHPADLPLEVVTLENKHLRATFSNRGAVCTDLRLLEFDIDESFRTKEGEKTQLLNDAEKAWGHFGLAEIDGDQDSLTVHWKVVDKGDDHVEFQYLHPDGIDIRKKFTMSEDKYTFDVMFSFQNVGKDDLKPRFRIVPFNGMISDGVYHHQHHSQGMVGAIRGQYRDPWLLRADQVIQEPTKYFVGQTGEELDWIGTRNRYFTTVFIPKKAKDRAKFSIYRLTKLSPEAYANAWSIPGVRCEIDTSELNLPASDELKPDVFKYEVYAGPIDPEALAQAHSSLEQVYDPYGFNFLAAMFLGVLDFFHMIFRNWGIAILFTTLLIRICLFPLTKKAQVSSFRMQQLQPKMKTMKERYKADPQKMNKEMWKMYREEGVNPLSGCLPMFLQLPIFIAMFGVYRETIDLRQAPFFLWMTDLSQPDRLAGPFEGPISLLFFTMWEFNLLPVIMAATWFVNMKFQPMAPDPQMQMQQNIMKYMMPVMFFFFCYYYAAALSFYFFVNSLLAIAEQKIIKKVFLKPPGEGDPGPPDTGGKKKKKKKWAPA